MPNKLRTMPPPVMTTPQAIPMWRCCSRRKKNCAMTTAWLARELAVPLYASQVRSSARWNMFVSNGRQIPDLRERPGKVERECLVRPETYLNGRGCSWSLHRSHARMSKPELGGGHCSDLRSMRLLSTFADPESANFGEHAQKARGSLCDACQCVVCHLLKRGLLPRRNLVDKPRQRALNQCDRAGP